MFHAAMLLWVAGISHLLHGDVNTHAMAWLLVGSIPGVLIGSQPLDQGARARRCGSAFGCRADPLRASSSCGVPYANYIIAGGVVCLGIVLVAWLVRQVRIRRVARVSAPEAT